VKGAVLEKALHSTGDRSRPKTERVLAIRIAGPVRPEDLLDLIDATETQTVQNTAILTIARKLEPKHLLARHAKLGPESRKT
ncbi:uncharacterized protein METZ01_LOCUS440046, partial [marine metagenome]